MTVVTTRPNATVKAGATAVPSGTRHGVTSDSDDSTYLNQANNDTQLGFAEPSPPAGSVFKESQLRIRTRRSGGGTAPLRWWFFIEGYVSGEEAANGKVSVTWKNWVTHVLGTITEDGSDLVVKLERTTGSSANLHISEIYLDSVYVEKPDLTVDFPTGTLNNTTAPVVSWTPTLDEDGDFQTAYEVKVFDDDQYGAGGFDPDTSDGDYESGVVRSADVLHQLTEPIDDDTYRAYVRIAQTVDGDLHWSDWEYSAFTLSTDRPAAPTIVASGQPTQARVQLDVETFAGDVSSDFIEIERSADGGETWTSVRRRSTDQDAIADEEFFVIEDGVVHAWDYEAPNGAITYYRARTLHDFEPGYSRSEWSDADTAIWESAAWWLKTPEGDRIEVRPFSLPRISRSVRAGVMQALGSSRVVVTSDKRGPWSGSIVFETDSTQEQEEIDGMLETSRPLLLQGPQGVHWTDRWLAFGEQDRAWMVDKHAVEDTFESLPFTVVDRPDGYVADAPTTDAEDTVDPEEIVFL